MSRVSFSQTRSSLSQQNRFFYLIFIICASTLLWEVAGLLRARGAFPQSSTPYERPVPQRLIQFHLSGLRWYFCGQYPRLSVVVLIRSVYINALSNNLHKCTPLFYFVFCSFQCYPSSESDSTFLFCNDRNGDLRGKSVAVGWKRAIKCPTKTKPLNYFEQACWISTGWARRQQIPAFSRNKCKKHASSFRKCVTNEI